MPRQARRAEREAALGRYEDTSAANKALLDATQAFEAEKVARQQHPNARIIHTTAIFR